MTIHTAADVHKPKQRRRAFAGLFLACLALLVLSRHPPADTPKSDFAESSWAADDTCDLFKGDWVPDTAAPRYTNETCWSIQEHQNCLKYGRPDTGYLQWRWQPQGCPLRQFEPTVFLQAMRGKKMAFVGDSLARNQMQSLMCLLSTVEVSKDTSMSSDENYKRVLYPAHEFSIWMVWSPFLVKAEEPQREGPPGLWKLHLDEVDATWAAHLSGFDYVVISAGNWYSRPSIYYHDGRPVGCNYCNASDVKRLSIAHANRKAFQTAFRAVVGTEAYGGVTFLRTLSPSHFENGSWNQGGDCRRTRPSKRGETRMDGEEVKLYRDQVEEFFAAAEAGRRRGLEFRLLDVTEAMVLRPDGHPSRFGHWPEANVTLYNDCVHWCLPGPIDVWNQLLFHILLPQ